MTTYGEASVVSGEHSPHLDLSFVSPEAVDQVRREQYQVLGDATYEALLDPERWRETVSDGQAPSIRERVAPGFDAGAVEYVEKNLDNVPPDARELVRKVAVPWVIKCSVHHMDDVQWYLGEEAPDGTRLQSGWAYLEERVNKLKAVYEGRTDDESAADDETLTFLTADPEANPKVTEEDPHDPPIVERRPYHRRWRDLPMLGAVSVMNVIDSFRDRHRQRREAGEHGNGRYAALAAGGLALAGVGLYLLLDRAGVAHHIASIPRPGRSPSPHLSPPPSGSVPTTGHHFTGVPHGTEVLGPTQTAELTRNWADGTNARHILHFVSERRGQVTLQLENVAPDGTIINGHPVDLTQADSLRANITVNVNGQLNTVSVPMQGDSLNLHGSLARLINSGRFSSVEVVRQHGETEQVFSTVTGRGRRISARALRSYLGQIQQHQQVTSQGAGGNSRPRNVLTPPPLRKTPPPDIIRVPAERGESPNDDTGFWHNPVVDGVMIAAGVGIAAGAAVAADRNNRRRREPTPDEQHTGLDIMRADSVSLPAEREQEYADQIHGIMQEGDTSWLQPGRTREEYIGDFTPVAERAVDELNGNMSVKDRNKLVVHLVKEYCAGSPDEIYDRLRGVTDSAEAPEVVEP